MLELIKIKKIYPLKFNDVIALKDVSLTFREKEFVSILGPSGCGKTTMLNIIGGLDRYTEGDLRIEGISTKEFKDPDWDQYRNHRIGFVFQNYHLIPHLSVIENVALALTLSGETKSNRLEKAKKALVSVGLSDQLFKKPNQLSGGQQQRVAIARALVNDPDIILADEPTGAIDSKTSEMIMILLKEIATTRLVIMVTHNPDLANRYSDRIVEFLDGEVVSDSNPHNIKANDEQIHVKKKTA
ncbi:MAG: ABC transporter ATP-binding protein, partial [Acholeplasmataceae bacterium]